MSEIGRHIRLTKQLAEIRAEALSRAQGGLSMGNYGTILREFTARGIPEAEILPRENVYTYRAWQALGRQVRRGEHGVRVVTFVPTSQVERAADGSEKRVHGKRPWSATVFHVSQTDAAADGAAGGAA